MAAISLDMRSTLWEIVAVDSGLPHRMAYMPVGSAAPPGFTTTVHWDGPVPSAYLVVANGPDTSGTAVMHDGTNTPGSAHCKGRRPVG